MVSQWCHSFVLVVLQKCYIEFFGEDYSRLWRVDGGLEPSHLWSPHCRFNGSLVFCFPMNFILSLGSS